MWLEATIIATLAIFATARPTDEIGEKHNDHDYANSYEYTNQTSWEICSNLTGYPLEKVYEKIIKKTSFCDEEEAKTWITCFYKKEGAMDENYVINDILFIEESTYDKEKLNDIKECMNEANTEDDFERACTFDDCLEANKLIKELEDELENLGENFHDHNHHDLDIHSNGEEDELDLEEDDSDDVDDYDDKNGHEPISDEYGNDKNEEGEPNK